MLENNGNSLNFFGMGNSKGCINSNLRIERTFQTCEKILRKISALPVPLHAGLKSDLRTLHSGMGVSTMWSDGRHLECVVSGYDDS